MSFRRRRWRRPSRGCSAAEGVLQPVRQGECRPPEHGFRRPLARPCLSVWGSHLGGDLPASRSGASASGERKTAPRSPPTPRRPAGHLAASSPVVSSSRSGRRPAGGTLGADAAERTLRLYLTPRPQLPGRCGGTRKCLRPVRPCRAGAAGLALASPPSGTLLLPTFASYPGFAVPLVVWGTTWKRVPEAQRTRSPLPVL